MNERWTNQSPSASPTILPPGANGLLTVAVEPENGADFLLRAINSAQRSLWMEMYEFTDVAIGSALLAAAGRGVDVQLLYEPEYIPSGLFPSGQSSIPPWVRPNSAVNGRGEPIPRGQHHAKFLLVDAGIQGRELGFILTANFTADALGSGRRLNREYLLCDANPFDIRVLTALFAADQQAKPFQMLQPTNQILDAPNLIVSPDNSHQQLTALISSARQNLAIQTEELNDPDEGSLSAQTLSVELALTQAAQRGVEIWMMLPPQGTGDRTIPDSSAAIERLSHIPHIQIKTQSQYYMHAKLVIADQRLGFVGSQNLVRASLNYNREVGLMIADSTVLQTLWTAFTADWNGAH